MVLERCGESRGVNGLFAERREPSYGGPERFYRGKSHGCGVRKY